MTDTSRPTKLDKAGYFVFTGFLTATMLFSAGMYIFTHEEAREAFAKLGYPTYLVYPLAIAKLLGIVAIWTRLSMLLMNLAYAGFLFNFILALWAHLEVADADYPPACLALLFLSGSFVFQRRVFGRADS